MPTPYTFLPATTEHLGWLRILYTAMMAEEKPTHPKLNTASELDKFTLHTLQQLVNNPFYGCWIARIGKKYIGFLVGEIVERALGVPHKFGVAHWLYVEPKHRSCGVATELLALGHEFCVLHHVDTVELVEQYGHGNQWLRRGFTPYLVRYHAPLSKLLKNSVPQEHANRNEIAEEILEEPPWELAFNNRV